MTSPSIQETLQEYARGAGGGLLFSLPLLFTMEVWATGEAASSARLLAFLGGAFVLLLGYNHIAGLHDEHPTLSADVFEAVEELGLGLLLAAAVLLLLGHVGPGVAFREAVGKVIVEGTVAAVGLAIGTEQLGETTQPEEMRKGGFGREMLLAVLGAVLVAANVAPTDEILIIALSAPPWALLAMPLIALGAAAGLLHFSAFRGGGRLQEVDLPGGFAGGAVLTYAVGLAVSAALLWGFGRLDGVGLPAMIGQTVVLSVPAVLGAAAGRLLLGGGGGAA